ncbi:MAG: heavy metal translocating P-type ATPase [Acidimicrobiia bacterium]|nr:MAG: heavy metal translocating P-type ATPase [Acidimicrobiia bacterium]
MSRHRMSAVGRDRHSSPAPSLVHCTCCRLCTLETAHDEHAGHDASTGVATAEMTHDEHAGHDAGMAVATADMTHDEHAGHDAGMAVATADMTHDEHADHDAGMDGATAEMAHDEHAGHDGEHADHADIKAKGGHHDHTDHEAMFRQRFWVNLVLTVPVLYWSVAVQGWFGYTAPEFTGSWLIVPVLSTVVFFYGGWPFIKMSGWELRDRTPAMMTLIAVAISVAYFFSMATLVFDLGEDFFWELVTLVDIMLLGHWMEMRAVRQASGALDALAQLMPDTAEVVLPDGSIEERSPESLVVGDVVLIRPGASAPADGVVVDGSSDLDEAMITGESKPVKRAEGDPVIGGTVNSGSGSLRVEVSAVGDDTALSGIMALVAEAQASKSKTQLLADRAASFLFYTALAAAGIAAVGWTIFFGGFDARTVAVVVTVLVIACPHALGLAIPLVVANTTEIAAKNGTLIRNREAIDTAKDLDIIMFDKTGTLTEGRIGVVEIAVGDGMSDGEALGMAAAVEGDSEHPVARAILQAAAERSVAVPEVSDFEVLKGRGVKGVVGGSTVYVGGPRLIEFVEAVPPEVLATFAFRAGARGESVVYVVSDGTVVAGIALSDVVRPESRVAVDALRTMDVEVAMLTGDSKDVAAAVAGDIGIETYFAEVLPADKDKHVAELQAGGRRVGMVGDGVNDAPALTRADIGIAIGSGTDVAVQSADLVLVKSNPLDVVKIIKLSSASYRKQLQNVWWGAGYNIVMIPLAMGILAPFGFVMAPAVGAVFMSLSTIVVAVNAQLLRRVDLSV